MRRRDRHRLDAVKRPSHSPDGFCPMNAASYAGLKRSADLLVSVVLLPPIVLVIAACMAIVKLTSRGPAIYTQTRVGLDGKPFTFYKIRSMRHDCERDTGPKWSTTGDDRVTAFGRFLRKSHIDELPQIWNVLKGDMSLVGPRPERPSFVTQLEQAFPEYRRRLEVRPGVTGLAQVQLPPDVDLESVRQKLVCDIYYVENMNLWLDFRLLLITGVGLMGIKYGMARKVIRIPVLEQIESENEPVSGIMTGTGGSSIQPQPVY